MSEIIYGWRGEYPCEPSTSPLAAKLKRYIHQVDEGASFELFVEPILWQHISRCPRYMAYVKTDEDRTPTKKVEFFTASESEQDQEEWVATLAHEAGHVEQGIDIRGRKASLPPTELDAWRRGIKWAVKWGVVSTYGEGFVHAAADPRNLLPDGEDFDRIMAQINNLLFKFLE